MTGGASIVLTLTCLVLYVVAVDIVRAPKMRALRRRLRLEKNRNRFGELRTDLVRRATVGELSPRSQIFESIYRSTTSLMRDPHAMEAAAQAILMIPAPESTRERGPKPSKAEGAIAREFASRIDLLCRDYSKAYMVGAWVLDRSGPPDDSPPLWIGMIMARAQKKKRIAAILHARKRLEATAQAAA